MVGVMGGGKGIRGCGVLCGGRRTPELGLVTPVLSCAVGDPVV